jgi:serine protease AprX
MVLSVLPAQAATSSAAPPTFTDGGQRVKADRDGDKVFEDIEGRLTRSSDDTKVDVMVRLDSPASPAELDALRHDAGQFEITGQFSVVDGFAATMTKSQVRRLATERSVLHIEEDSLIRAVNDGAQSSVGLTQAQAEIPGLTGDADGNPKAYSRADMVAAVLDTGIDAGHRDLDGGKVIAFKDLVNGRANTYDDNGHGTHVAATLAGEGDANPLHRGAAPGAGLVGVKILNAEGSGSEAAVIQGIEWTLANKDAYGIEALNLSLAGDRCSNGTDALSLAVNRIQQAGLVVVVAAGNSGPGTCTIGSPGAANGAVTVGAMADLSAGGFAQSLFSSRGPTADGRVKPDLSAPGERITSAAYGTTGGYRELSGTSMASPLVAGVALLMREAKPALSSQEVKQKLMATAVDWARGGDNTVPGSTGPDIDYGAGQLDAHAALKSAGAPLGSAPVVPLHARMEGTFDRSGAQVERELYVSDTRFPIAATLITPSVTSARSTLPDFSLSLVDPGGNVVSSGATTNRQEVVRYLPAVAGTYRLRVSSYAGTGGYLVDVSVGGRLANAWSDWQPLGGGLRSGPAVASRGPGRLDVFVRGTDDALWQRSFGPGGWGNWQPLGGLTTAEPAAVSSEDASIDVFVRGTDNALWQRSFGPGG